MTFNDEYANDLGRFRKIEDLRGTTLSAVQTNNNDEIIFTTTEGVTYALFHSQDCCESVYIEDVCGDLDDLVGTPILMAEEVSSIEGFDESKPLDGYEPESYTWTFYKLATIRGSVTIRFYGTSNGYYSESVSFGKRA